MLSLLISLGVFLILLNLFIWLYDEQKIKTSIYKSLNIFKKASIVILFAYLLIGVYVYLFIPNRFN